MRDRQSGSPGFRAYGIDDGSKPTSKVAARGVNHGADNLCRKSVSAGFASDFGDTLAPRRIESLKPDDLILGKAVCAPDAPQRALRVQPARLKATAAAAVATTTGSGGARHTIRATKPAAAMAKSVGSRTALVHTGL